MARVILKENVDSALKRGVQAVIDQDFQKGIDLLEFYFENMQGKEVPLEPLSYLMLAYFSTDQFDKANEIAVQLEKMPGLPNEVKELIRTIIEQRRAIDDTVKKVDETFGKINEFVEEKIEEINQLKQQVTQKGRDIIKDKLPWDWAKLAEVYDYDPTIKLIADFVNNLVDFNEVNPVLVEAMKTSRNNLDPLLTFGQTKQVEIKDLIKVAESYVNIVSEKTNLLFINPGAFKILGLNPALQQVAFVPSAIAGLYCHNLYDISQNYDFTFMYGDLEINPEVYNNMMECTDLVLDTIFNKIDLSKGWKDVIAMMATGNALASLLKYPDNTSILMRKEYTLAIIAHLIKEKLNLSEEQVSSLTTIKEEEIKDDLSFLKVIFNPIMDNVIAYDKDNNGNS